MSSELVMKDELAGECIKVSIAGEIDIYTSQKLKEKLYSLIDTHQKDMRVDCQALNYIDSTGLGIFVGALKKSKQLGKNIYMSGLKENIRKLFVITGLDKLFIIE